MTERIDKESEVEDREICGPRPISVAASNRWLEENAEALESSNSYFNMYGLPLEEFRMF